MASNIKQALIFCAGHGSRLRPLTNYIAKPLIKIGNMEMLEHIICMLIKNNVTNIHINTHYHSSQINEFINRKRTLYNTVNFYLHYEKNLLNTGGTLIKLKKYFLNQPLYVCNADALFFPKNENFLLEFKKEFFTKKLLSYLYVISNYTKIGHYSKNDFFLSSKNHLSKSNNISQTEKADLPVVFSGLQIISPSIIPDQFIQAISLVKFWHNHFKDNLIKGKLFQGHWCHVGDIKGYYECLNFLQKNH